MGGASQGGQTPLTLDDELDQLQARVRSLEHQVDVLATALAYVTQVRGYRFAVGRATRNQARSAYAGVRSLADAANLWRDGRRRTAGELGTGRPT